MNRRKTAITLLAALHLVVTFWHGRAHQVLSVTLPPEKNAFVFIVIIVAPLVGAALVWTRLGSVGVWIFFLSMCASFLFGVYHHYLVVSNDHIHHLPAGNADVQSAFVASAAALAVLEVIATVYSAFCLARPGRTISG
jgi:hypothetical protein